MTTGTVIEVEIPSSSPRLLLEGTVCLPWETPPPTTLTPALDPFQCKNVPYKRLAIISHPWGRLGGSKNDPVLTRVLRPTLLQAGYIVVTYNARGVGKSAGWQSWVGGGEGEDASEVARWAWEMMGCDNTDKGTLLSCGYSYGSLAATLSLPTLQTRYPHLDIHCVLISPPISIISGFAWLPVAARKFQEALKIAQSTLVVSGDCDQFTGAQRYRTWAEGFPSSGFSHVEFEGADHFWRGGNGQRLSDALSEWTGRLTPHSLGNQGAGPHDRAE